MAATAVRHTLAAGCAAAAGSRSRAEPAAHAGRQAAGATLRLKCVPHLRRHRAAAREPSNASRLVRMIQQDDCERTSFFRPAAIEARARCLGLHAVPRRHAVCGQRQDSQSKAALLCNGERPTMISAACSRCTACWVTHRQVGWTALLFASQKRGQQQFGAPAALLQPCRRLSPVVQHLDAALEQRSCDCRIAGLTRSLDPTLALLRCTLCQLWCC